MIGSGKTTLGKALAERLGWPFQDMDSVMELDAGKSFREVVDEEGWLGFRAREYRTCKQFAKTARGKTVSEETAELIETLQREHLICTD